MKKPTSGWKWAREATRFRRRQVTPLPARLAYSGLLIADSLRSLVVVVGALNAARDQCRPVSRGADSCMDCVRFMVVREDGWVSKELQRMVPVKFQGVRERFILLGEN